MKCLAILRENVSRGLAVSNVTINVLKVTTFCVHKPKFLFAFVSRVIDNLCCAPDQTSDRLASVVLSNVSRINSKWFSSTTHTHTHPFNGPMSGTTRVSQYQKGKSNLNFTEARDSEWQWHQLGHMQVCTSRQTYNHTSTPPLSFLQAGCPSCRPTKSVKALKAKGWSSSTT